MKHLFDRIVHLQRPHRLNDEGNPAKEVTMLFSVSGISLKGSMPCGAVILSTSRMSFATPLWDGITFI